MKILDFDDVFQYIGGFGPYQYMLFAAICVCNCFYAFAYYGQIFMSLTPPHHCKINDAWEEAASEFNIMFSKEEKLRISIPLSENGHDFDKCRRYVINLTEIIEGEKFNQSSQWPIIDCDSGWDYDFTSYYPSITSQLNWVCSEDWKPPFAQLCFFLGSLVGGPLFGWLADRFGRFPIIIATNVIGGAFGIASAFSSSFTEYCALRFFVGTIFDSNLMVIYILGLEFVSAKYRSIVANVPILLFLTTSICALPWIAYFIHDWTILGIVVHAPMLLIVVLYFLSPESVRWLAGKGKAEKALHIVKKAASVNGKILSDEFHTEFNAYLQSSATIQCEKVTYYDLLKTPRLRKRFLLLCVMWLAIMLAYDGHMRHTENTGFNFFMTFTILGATELPADLITIFLMEWIGRKYTVVWTLIFSGLFAVGTVLIDEGETLKLLMVAVSGRFFITMSINVGMQYMIEVLPTAGRAQGSSAIHTLGFGILLLSPYIVYLAKIRFWIPYAIFGVISILGGLTSLLLPETMGEKLPDSLNDGEEFFKDQKIFFNPFNKSKSLDAHLNNTERYLRRSSIAETNVPNCINN